MGGDKRLVQHLAAQQPFRRVLSSILFLGYMVIYPHKAKSLVLQIVQIYIFWLLSGRFRVLNNMPKDGDALLSDSIINYTFGQLR